MNSNIENEYNVSSTTEKIIIFLTLISKRRYKSKEIAKILNCSYRQVYRLANGIKKSGIKINATRGKNGGYLLEDNRIEISEDLYIKMLENVSNFKK